MKDTAKYILLAVVAALALWVALTPPDGKKPALLQKWSLSALTRREPAEPAPERPAEQLSSPLQAGELISFLVENLNPATGLPPTAITKSSAAVSQPGFSSTYVDAVAHQALLLANRKKEAERIAEIFRLRGEKLDLPDALNCFSGLSEELGVSVGPNVYWGLSFLRQFQATGDKKWLQAAAERADFAIAQQDYDGGIRKRKSRDSSEYWAKSTEENLDAYALFDWLYQETGSKLYKVAQERLSRWLAESGVYDRKERFFTIGTFKDAVTPVYSVDANALAVIILGPAMLDSEENDVRFGGAGTARHIIESFARAKAEVEYIHPGGAVLKNVTGFDFSDASGRPQRQPAVSPEFTAQALLAYLVLAAYEKRLSPERAQPLVTEAKAYLDELGRIAARSDGSASLPYATQKGIRRFAFDDWQTPSAEADLSALWVAYPLAGFNPFARNAFAVRDALKDIAPWLASPGPVSAVAPRALQQPPAVAPVRQADLKLKAYSQAPRVEEIKPPFKYYKVLYEQVEKDTKLARIRAISALMTSYSALVDGMAPRKNLGYAIGIGGNNFVIKRKLGELPAHVAKMLREEYIYYDADYGIKWHIAPKYNLNANYGKGTYYAFEIDADYNIVRRFLSLSDVPAANKGDLQDIKAQYQSAKNLPPGHVIARYFAALEIDNDMKIIKAYDNLKSLPAIVSKVPISRADYERYIIAEGKEREKLMAAGVAPNERGMLAEEEDGEYYANILALDETRRLRVSGVSAQSGKELVLGTRSSLGNWKLNETAKLNSIKYEEGLLNGMVVKPRTPSPKEKVLPTDPLWVVLGNEVVDAATAQLKARLLEILKKIKSEKDLQLVKEYIGQYDALLHSLAWDDPGFGRTVIYYGARAADSRLAAFDKARVRFEASPTRYESILGQDGTGRDIRDPYGRVWLKTVDKLTGKLLTVEVYDIGGNIETLYAADISIDPATKKVSASMKTDLVYDPQTYQLIGSHTYKIDQAGRFAQDISQGVFRGYTPDRQHYIMEKQVLIKDENGRPALQPSGEPKYRSRMEYYSIDGELAAEIYNNIITVRSGQYPNITKEIFIIPPDRIIDYSNENLADLMKGQIWVRRTKSPANISTFREILVKSLKLLPEYDREKAAAAVIKRLAEEKIQPDNNLLLGESEFINVWSETGEASGEDSSFYFYEPGDSRGRPRIVIKSDSIQIPVDWIEDTETPAKTLVFNLAGELISSGEVEGMVRADSVIPAHYLKKMAILGIQPETPLPKLVKKTFRLVTGKDGQPHFTDAVSVRNVSYLMPNDILGRDVMSIKYTMEGNATIRSLVEFKESLVARSGLGTARRSSEKYYVAKKVERVINEWYKQWMDLDELKVALLEDIFQNAVESGKMKSESVPKTYGQLQRGLMTGRIKPWHLPVPAEEVKRALNEVRLAPLGISPGAHALKQDKTLESIKYFAGTLEYPRAEFGYSSFKITPTQEVKPFNLPAGPSIKGLRYGVLTSEFLFHSIYSFNGQMLVREQPFVIMQLMNLYPIFAGAQTEYYDPLAPHYFPKPIKIERLLNPGEKPKIVSVFLNDSRLCHSNGWQTMSFLERNSYDEERWSISDLHFDETGVCKFREERLETKLISYKPVLLWGVLAAAAAIAMVLLFVISRLCRRKMLASRRARILRAASDAKAGIVARGFIKPFSTQSLNRLEAGLNGYGVSQELVETLKAECIKVYSLDYDPAELYRITAAIYIPLIESRLRMLKAEPGHYTAGIHHLVERIAARIGREDINLNGLYPLEIKEFGDWSCRLGHHFGFENGKLTQDGAPVSSPTKLLTDDIFLLVLYRLIFEESKEFKAAIPAFRYYLFDKCVVMLTARQKDILASSPKETILEEIRSDVWALMEALRPGYDRKPLIIKADKLIFEDVNDIFNGHKPDFLPIFLGLTGLPKEAKLAFLAGKGAGLDVKSHKSYLWLKTYRDATGVTRFFFNLRSLWLIFSPLFMATILGALTIGVGKFPFSPAADQFALFVCGLLSPTLAIPAAAVSYITQYLITVSAGLGLSYLLFQLLIPGGRFPDIAQSEYHANARRALRFFWLMFAVSSYLWGGICTVIVVATVKTFAKLTILSLGWDLAIRGGIVVLTASFILASYSSVIHIVMSVFSYFQGKREGSGQIVSWRQLKNNFATVRERFAQVMLPAKETPSHARTDELWQLYWNAIVTDLYADFRINQAEANSLMLAPGKSPDFSKDLGDGEANYRLRFFANSWLMDVPKAESWVDLPTLTVLISAFNEPVSYSFDELNGCERGATLTRLNHLIENYRKEWIELVTRIPEKELGGVVSRQDLAGLKGLKRLPSDIPEELRQKITRWANVTVQCVEKTLRDVAKIRTAFLMYAHISYPQATWEDLSRLVADKLQILISYEGYHHGATPDWHRVALRRVMKEVPYLEAYWNSSPKTYSSGEREEAVEYYKDCDAGLHRYNPASGKVELIEVCPQTIPIKRGKPTGLNQALSFVRGETILFFDANTAVRLDDALKLPVALSEFRNDPYLGEILIMEYTFNKRFSWIIDAFAFSEETFTSATQRALNMFQACGFYGHSAIVRTDAITLSGGFPQDYVSEDILLATSLWEKGFGTTHKEYLMFGKGRETSYFSSLVPITKWAMGAAEISIGRITPSILYSRHFHAAQKFLLFFGFSFFYMTPLMLVINFMYLWFMLCWGVNGFITIPSPILAGIVGLCLNQAIMSAGIVNLLSRVGFMRAAIVYLRLIGKNLFFSASVIPAYAYGFLAGIRGKAVFIVSSKGWNLGHVPLKNIWGEHKTVLLTAILTSLIGMPLLYMLMAMGLLSYVVSPFIPFMPFITIGIMYFIGVIGERIKLKSLARWKTEMLEHDDTRMVIIKLQIIYAMGLLIFSVIGALMWGIGFSSLQVKAMFLVSALYITSTISYIVMPLFAHAQPAVLFKEITSSRLWNFLLVPLCAGSISISIGSMFPYMGSSDFIYFFITIMVGWLVLKWHLSAYDVLHKWLRKNFTRYKTLPYSALLEVMDTIYFRHQELTGLTRPDKQSDYPALVVRGVVAGTLIGAVVLYALYQISIFSYPWLILMLAIVYFTRHVVLLREERIVFKELINSLNADDMRFLRDDARAIYPIWSKINLDYKKRLTAIYGEENKARLALADYLKDCADAVFQPADA